jgi:PPM family protein phosphatase
VVAALVADGGRIAFAHVGDSRAYLLRGGTLQRLSEDHTLVGELVRKGELSEADAERHPQRNVITRSLGADADVEADTFGLDAQEGDVVLLCSDGLNTMIDEAEIGRLMADGGDAAGRARDLVRAALAAGGEDNVTAVVFVIGEAADDDEQTSGEHILPDRIEIDDDDTPARRSRARTAVRLTVAALIAVGLAVAAVTGLRWSHFVGADERTGRVAIYQGLPIDLPFGVHLYHETELTPISFATLSASQRKALFDHSLQSLADARAAVRPIEAASP